MNIIECIKTNTLLPSIPIEVLDDNFITYPYNSTYEITKDMHNDYIKALIIKRVIRREYAVSDYDLLLNKSRKSNLIDIKRMLYYLIYTNCPHLKFYVRIARMFNKNHATMIHHIAKMEGFLFYDSQMKKSINNLNNLVQLEISSNIFVSRNNIHNLN